MGSDALGRWQPTARIPAVWVALCAVAATAAAPPQTGQDFFESRVRPILVARCFECHAQSAGKPSAALMLDTRVGLRRGGQSGPAIVPGKPDQSLLIKKVRSADSEQRMPPAPKQPLSDAEVGALVAWVRMGAPDPRGGDSSAQVGRLDLEQAGTFWSFRPIVADALPVGEHSGWAANPVDLFLQARWKSAEVRPVSDAPRRVLLRRVYFDLLGLPPTRAQLSRDLADPTADAWSRLADRLLASPHYGERWGRHWLDVVRYADSQGDENQDFPIPQAYKYRNYVIDAFNQDTPFDLFVREQIAGDRMPDSDPVVTRRRRIATGFLAMSRRQGGQEHLTIEDTIDTLGRSVLGLALGSARCHDHKFDPISHRDYYALYGFFSSSRYASVVEAGPFYQRDFVPLISQDELRRQLGPAREQLAALDRELEEFEKMRKQVVSSGGSKEQLAKLDERRSRADKQRAELLDRWPRIDDAYAVVDGEPANARLQRGGSPQQLGEEIPRRFLTVLGGQELASGSQSSGRAALAGWLTAASNPLTPRVAVNRIWQHHFGQGIVATPSDFGVRGQPPTHPRLLDFLSARFLDSGWSVKYLHRLLLGSRVYRLASRGGGANRRRDPENQLLWRFRRRRLDAEPLRDAILAISGDLDYSIGQRHPFPYKQKGWTGDPFRTFYDTRLRSVYVMQQKRVQRHPFFGLFDGADPNLSTSQRTVSTSPLQALYFLNDEWVAARAESFARRLVRLGDTSESRLRAAFQMVYGRDPGPDERRAAIATLQVLHRQARGESAEEQTRWVWARLAGVLLISNEFSYID